MKGGKKEKTKRSSKEKDEHKEVGKRRGRKQRKGGTEEAK
jgi:hypothetical protein